MRESKWCLRNPCVWWSVMALGVAIALAYLWSIAYCGIGSPDESLHWTQPWRFLQGDIPLRHEWHPSVLCGILMTPVLFVLQCLGAGSEGFMVFARHSFALLWCVCMIYASVRWRKLHPAGALVGLMAVIVYPPWRECNFSYNAMGVSMLTVAFAVFSTLRTCGLAMLFDCVLVGALFAIGVLCCPHLVVLYLIYSAYALRKDRVAWLLVSLGCLLIAVPFCVFVFSRLGLSEFISLLSVVANDPEHPATSVVVMLRNALGRFLFITHDLAYGHACIMIGLALSALVSMVDRKSRTRSLIYICTSSAGAIALFLYYLAQPMVSANPCYMVLPLLAGCVMPLVRDPLAKHVFLYGWVPAAGYASMMSLSSNLGLYSISLAFEVAMFPSLIILLLLERESHGAVGTLGRIASIAIWCPVLFHYVVAYMPVVRQWGNPRTGDTVALVAGPMKGAEVSPEIAFGYNSLLDDTMEMRHSESVRNVLYLSHPNQWLYLASAKGNGAFSSWMCGVNQASLDRLALYWTLNPEKKPEAILLPVEHLQFLDYFKCSHGYTPEVKQSGNIVLWKGPAK